mmetsp:Transcript_3607/g.5057  ORF Transcript_3607/g.5057 Transcript_3607/m.5057 type:complete len:415 (-) Transcript_3607:820-2064(-)
MAEGSPKLDELDDEDDIENFEVPSSKPEEFRPRPNPSQPINPVTPVTPVKICAHELAKEFCLPTGIAEEFIKSTETLARRYWLIDNSASMTSQDGHRYMNDSDGGGHRMDRSTRWDELKDTLHFVGRMAIKLQAWTEFRLINKPPNHSGYIRLGLGENDEVDLLMKFLETIPLGHTPLCTCLKNLENDIKRHAEQVKDLEGKYICVVISTDGEPTDVAQSKWQETVVQIFINLLHKLANGVKTHILIRPCTDVDNIVKFWNDIDKNLDASSKGFDEFSLDVLDDLAGECKDVMDKTPWLTYGPELHRLREWGVLGRIFDDIDESPINIANLVDIIGIIFGSQVTDTLPPPQGQKKDSWGKFLQHVSVAQDNLKERGNTFNAVKNEITPWIDLKKLDEKFKPKKKKKFHPFNLLF